MLYCYIIILLLKCQLYFVNILLVIYRDLTLFAKGEFQYGLYNNQQILSGTSIFPIKGINKDSNPEWCFKTWG